MTRHAGLVVPLFSVPSSRSWGIGEIPDLVALTAWMAGAGLDRLMLLPLGTVPVRETSPYSAASSMAIDPIYVAMDDVEDFQRAGGIAALPADLRARLGSARQSATVRYADVRAAKAAALALAFQNFRDVEWRQKTTRAAGLAAFMARESWWLDDDSLFSALVEAHGPSWRAWPAPLRDRDPQAIALARRAHVDGVLRAAYAQWLAAEQWTRAHAAARTNGVAVVGDLPFVVAGDSADVWARAGEYLLDVSVGAPPDAFSDEGQDWQLPGYRWPLIAERGFELFRRRARRMASLFDGVRIDHLVGLYRTWNRPASGEPFFLPDDEPTQVWQGESVLRIFQETGAFVLAEDLGTVPGYVRASMARLGVPGTKVLRWERRWHEPGQPFIEPDDYPAVSVAMTGTHDTEPLAEWWLRAGRAERESVFALQSLREAGFANPADPWSNRLRDALLAVAWRCRSAELFMPMPDLFGWRDRINVPGTIAPTNWTWRLPWPVDEFGAQPEVQERAGFLSRLADRHGPA